MTAFDVMDDKFHLTQQPADSNGVAAPADKGRRINLLNWDGKNTDGLCTAAPVSHGPDANGGPNGAAKESKRAAEPTR
jgi:nitrate reductase beta subunit